MSWQFASAVSRVVLPSCTTHAAEESLEQAAMLQVRGGLSEVIMYSNQQTIVLVKSHSAVHVATQHANVGAYWAGDDVIYLR